ncbi:glycogen debranching protein [Massilia violaceinigra]|uniref:Glycogen debranching protein n=1 Tax=Massilia violaceinigra TaxID=2045208 RepID=A0A2D2DKI7_9BURK|nr:amylo-alpha-1,6-glucosidase [Massilia violaceinigra]ATQ75465.1 glycogen debranching protein [Massilia violaceinigra]
MKYLIALAAAIAMPITAAAGKPGVDAFFDAMAISVPPGQQPQFVVGDNLAGYFEGYTQSYDRGAGYTIRNASMFEGYATFVNGTPNERTRSSEQVLPYGHRVRHAGGAIEEMALLSKKHALAIRLTNPADAELAVQALLKAPGAIGRDGDVVVVAPADAMGLFTAIAANRPFVLGDGLTLRSAQAVRDMTVVVAFGDTAAQASERALAQVKLEPIDAERKALYEALTKSYLSTSDAEYNKALNWAKAASRMFVVEEFGTGIWAGLPWFRDNWGRDTFIALPGTLLVSGQFDEAKAVLSNFARYQNLREPRDKEYGRIPNRVAAGDSIIYNTVDGTPWMLREAFEYIQYTGDKAFARQMYQLALPYFDGALANYVDQDGLLAHDSADTWMDARIDNKDPWSARGPRAVEIQALWHTALKTGAWLATQAGDKGRARQWNALAAKAQRSFLKLYWDGSSMADRLRDDASRDTKIRPNQLMLVSIPFDDFIAPLVQARVTRNAVSELLYPYGIASLSQNDPYFHPRHENPAFHHKDAAYHQGTIWGWNAGFTVTALNKFGYQDLAWKLSQNLGQQILGLGTLGNMSELLDALPGDDGKPTPSGTYAQSWSVAEYARNGYQDYVGFRPRLLDNTLAFTPAIPAAWSEFYATLPFGAADSIEVDFRRVGKQQHWTLRLNGGAPRKVSFNFLNGDKSRSQLAFELAPGKPALLVTGGGKATVNGKPLAVRPRQASYASEIGELVFQTPRRYRADDFPMLKSKDALKGIVERKEYR